MNRMQHNDHVFEYYAWLALNRPPEAANDNYRYETFLMIQRGELTPQE